MPIQNIMAIKKPISFNSIDLVDHNFNLGKVMNFNEFDVLMSVYSGDQLDVFTEAVESVLRNTITPKTFVIVVDGPVEYEVNQYIHSLENSNSFVFIRKLDCNMGLANALNIGLQDCESELVFRCDADDMNALNRFETQMRELNEYECDIIGAQIIEVDPLTNKSRVKTVPVELSEIEKYAHYRNPINHMSVLFKKSKILQLGGYPPIMYKEDYALWLKALNKGMNIRNSAECLVRARAGDSLITRRRNLSSLKSEFTLFYYRLKELRQPVLYSLISFIIRISILILPNRLLKHVYTFLRN